MIPNCLDNVAWNKYLNPRLAIEIVTIRSDLYLTLFQRKIEKLWYWSTISNYTPSSPIGTENEDIEDDSAKHQNKMWFLRSW